MSETLVCPECGAIVKSTAKFCGACGAPIMINIKSVTPTPLPPSSSNIQSLDEKIKEAWNNPDSGSMGIVIQNLSSDTKPVNLDEGPSEEGLTLLVIYSHSTTGLPNGRQLKQYCLYRNDKDNSYQVHMFSTERNSRVHKGYYVEKEAYDTIYAVIKETNLESYEHTSGNGSMGAFDEISFDNGKRMIRVTSEQAPMNLLTKVQNAFLPYIK